MKRRWLILLSLLVVCGIGVIAWRLAVPSEPKYEGKRLSAWLDELCKFDTFQQSTKGTAQIKAVRAMGTNAIPWLLQEFRGTGGVWRWRANQLLARQSLIKFQFKDAHDRFFRATTGFRALGELAEPAIPELLTLVEETPGYVPAVLAAIGRPAVPALQQCLTNMTLYTNSLGVYAIIPGNTISDIFNATSSGHLIKSDIEVFLPTIQAWAQQTTNRQAQSKAQFFLEHYDGL